MKPTPFWQKENFWTAIMMTVAAVFAVGGNVFPTAEAKAFITALFGAWLGGNFLFNYFKDVKVRASILEIIKSKNVWLNAFTVAGLIIPRFITTEVKDNAGALVDAINSGSLELMLVAGFQFIRAIYNIIKSQKPIPPAPAT